MEELGQGEEPSAADWVERHRRLIEGLWTQRVHDEIPALGNHTSEAIADNFPAVLDALVEALRTGHCEHGRGPFEHHAELRLGWPEYAAEHLIHEYVVLRKVTLAVLDRGPTRTAYERDVVADFVDLAIEIASARFGELAQREREQLEAESRRRDAWLAAVTHDLTSPLMAARLSAELLREQPQRAMVERVADQIVRSIDRSNRMIRDMLDVLRIGAGTRPPIPVEAFHMSDLVDDVVRELRATYGERFVVDAEPDVYGFWGWDAMRRALEHLLTNAVKYGDPRAPITIRVRKSHGELELSVHNAGRPMSREEQLRVFEPFERGAAAGDADVRGWGIGLTLSRSIVEAHGGTLGVESLPGRGTTFAIRTPMDSRPYGDEALPEELNPRRS